MVKTFLIDNDMVILMTINDKIIYPPNLNRSVRHNFEKAFTLVHYTRKYGVFDFIANYKGCFYAMTNNILRYVEKTTWKKGVRYNEKWYWDSNGEYVGYQCVAV